ncbi:MAG TPA: hypothetical protein VK906_06550 [Egicoccus sp.]|nr:hypothetical protein [Egicoccus sp.]HSK22815.1 hypothetical protein [Egicoccus sp.]
MSARLALVVLAAVLLACTSGEAEPDVVAEQGDVATYEDERLTFSYPTEFEIAHRGEGGEYSVRIVSPDGGDPAEATIFALWPLPTHDDLERTVNFYGPDTTSSAVSDFEERDIEVPGASAAVEHRFAATDAVPGEARPMRFVSVYAMAEAGRTLNLVVGVDEASDYDLDTLADTVLESLELKDFELTGEDGEQAAAVAAGSGGATDTLLEGRVHLDVPEDWTVDEELSSRRKLWIQSPDGSVKLFVEHLPKSVADEDLGTLLEQFEADATGEVVFEGVTVPGAVEAHRFRRRTEGGLWQQMAMARDGEGEVYSVILAADVTDAPSSEVVARIFGSFALAATGDDT